jgi:C4-dicarboxylate transporter DctQ subunit
MSWAQELTIIMFVWMAKFGAAYGVRTGIHVGVDVLINRLSEGQPRQVHPFWPVRRCAVHRHRGHAGRALRLGERGALRLLQPDSACTGRPVPEGPTTPDLEWPTWIVYSAIPLGTSLMCFRFLQVLVYFKTRRAAAPRPWPCDGMEDDEASCRGGINPLPP